MIAKNSGSYSEVALEGNWIYDSFKAGRCSHRPPLLIGCPVINGDRVQAGTKVAIWKAKGREISCSAKCYICGGDKSVKRSSG